MNTNLINSETTEFLETTKNAEPIEKVNEKMEMTEIRVTKITENTIVEQSHSSCTCEENLGSVTENMSNPDMKLEIPEVTSSDPALWPSEMHEAERGKYLQLGCNYFQNKHANYTSSLRIYKTQNRSFSSSMFVRVLANGEKHDRKWLMYSESTGCVFCYVCKLFSNANSRESKFVKGGFSDWKKATESITSHENSKEHKDCLIIWISRTSATNLIDKELATTIQNETRYWTEILNRVLAVIRFLAERGLAFRGKNEVVGASNNGNYLGALELIAQFDPFLEKHLQMHANKGRGHVSYLSKTICEEFIKILAAKVFTTILSEIKEAKYFGLIVDSTPDLSHIDQLTIVMRYCLKGSIIERFLCFIPIYSHTGESLSTEVLNLLENNSIDICDCRAQTYDNASNMSGKYNGCQALIKEKNELAYYVPCVAHSLNLIDIQCFGTLPPSPQEGALDAEKLDKTSGIWS
ncbi:PREDICTED: zinc finger MYM-type protein 1-like [Trachymyrmex cornetzi]|uniref:zinc finger MYM-type protein 1-like n=1 Tax=Trachymyrmex cornetzi TaxID=471704 RepID=UPI00084F5663|nr:PREDICTED: zinc finger MYM-type protein 1-like [Trachymyrmex cornetzi]